MLAGCRARAYVRVMYADKMPSLRMDRSELKCKSGCDYFGNPQWKGYCSKCHREQMQRQRRIEKREVGAGGTLPKPESRGQDKSQKVTSHSSFSKFEEKRLRQTDSLKKTNILKFNMFRKTSEDHGKESSERSRDSELKIPSSVLEAQKRDFTIHFPRLGQTIERDARKFVQTFILDVIKHLHLKTIDELSERIQCHYQLYVRRMDSNQHYADVDADTKELLIDFVEKHAMSYLHSYVFSPAGTEDERADARMHARIRQLGWVCPRHLECRVDQRQPRCRELLYDAINELISMDGLLSPGGKLACVRRCCTCVVALVAAAAGAPASADELLPALIFTVLKANPPRLVSNINFVTRFCNANRLMTGEGGYYFTNLCCAVSFIENLTAESLSMEKEEFECYMSMPATIGGSSWATALSLCDSLREAQHQRTLMEQLEARSEHVENRSNELAESIKTFKDEIMKKVTNVLARTPLEIRPRRPLPSVGKYFRVNTAQLVDINADTEQAVPTIPSEPPPPAIEPEEQVDSSTKETYFEDRESAKIYLENDDSPSHSPQLIDQSLNQNHKLASSMELLSPSPVFGLTSFDSRSIDELMTPEEFGHDHLVPGLSNVNYDIDLSDFSADNSVAEDLPKTEPPKDPFSPDGLLPMNLGLEQSNFDPFSPQTVPQTHIQNDPFSPLGFSQGMSDPFAPLPVNPSYDPFDPISTQYISQVKDPFSPEFNSPDMFHPASAAHILPAKDPFSPVNCATNQSSSSPECVVLKSTAETEPVSLLDNSESPTAACLLPSPLLPSNSNK